MSPEPTADSRPDRVRAALAVRRVSEHEIAKPDADIEHNGRFLLEAGDDAWREVRAACLERGEWISEREAKDIVEAYLSVYRQPPPAPGATPRRPPVMTAPTRPDAGNRPSTSWNHKAVWSIVFACLVVPLNILAAVPALILGDQAMHEIATSGQRGRRLASVAVVIAWLVVACFALLVVLIIASFLFGAAPG